MNSQVEFWKPRNFGELDSGWLLLLLLKSHKAESIMMGHKTFRVVSPSLVGADLTDHSGVQDSEDQDQDQDIRPS